jgi:hypothetical protein
MTDESYADCVRFIELWMQRPLTATERARVRQWDGEGEVTFEYVLDAPESTEEGSCR